MSYRTVTPLVPRDQDADGGVVDGTMSPARSLIADPPAARGKLMAALAEVVADKGYANATIADIVAAAHVSKRTFYEHFVDKEACLLAVYEHACANLMGVLRVAAKGDLPWRERVRLAAAGYLAAIEAMPEVNRALLVEMQAAGPRAFALRKRTQRQFAELLRELVEAGAADQGVRPLSPALALAIVGGINELLLHTIEPYAGLGADAAGAAGPDAAGPEPAGAAGPDGPAPGDGARDGRITGLTDAVTQLVCAVLAD